jgi:kynurenine formamidase
VNKSVVNGRGLVAVAVAFAALGAGSVAAYAGFRISTDGGAEIRCPRGMSRLSHVFDESASVFPGDPAPIIDIAATIEENGFLVENVSTGTHTSTHIDAPGHFIAGGRTVDELLATDLVWPAYVIDVRDRMTGTDADGFQLSVAEIRAYERANGRIPRGAMVIIQTGFEEFFGTEAYLGAAPGFAGDTVDWMVANRDIGGIGSDTFGPDATSDALFDATFSILEADRVALPGLNNLDSLSTRNDIIITGAVRLADGSGYQVDPLACHGRPD